jgi:hypothetical protein
MSGLATHGSRHCNSTEGPELWSIGLVHSTIGSSCKALETNTIHKITIRAHRARIKTTSVYSAKRWKVASSLGLKATSRSQRVDSSMESRNEKGHSAETTGLGTVAFANTNRTTSSLHLAVGF